MMVKTVCDAMTQCILSAGFRRLYDPKISRLPPARCHWLDFHLWCAEVQHQYKDSMMRLQRMEHVSGLSEQVYVQIMAEHGPSHGETIH